MTEKDHLDFIETKNEHLQKEKADTLRALEGVTSTRHVQVSLNRLDSVEPILDGAYDKILCMLSLKNGGFFIVDENTGHFSPYKFYPEEARKELIDETDRLIIDGTFSLAVKANTTTVIKSKELGCCVLLHALSTISRTRGIFIASLDMAKENIPDAVFNLVTVVMNDTAHQIESFELYSRNRTANVMLSESVKKLEESEKHLRNFNDKLETEVFNRTKELKATNELLENEISERKKIEKLLLQQKDALETLNSTLESRVEIETENRRKSERILHEQSKLAAMGQMMKAVSHQWRQPLNSLALLIQDVLDEYDHNGLSKEYLVDNINKSLKLVMHMSSTIDDFCDLVKSDFIKDSFDAITAVREVLSLVEKHYNSFGIFFDLKLNWKCDEHPDELTVKGDSGMFKQVIINLLSNAKDAIMPRLEIGRAEKGMIAITLSCDDKYVSVSVEDNGGGIPEDILDRVFEPYFTTKRQGKGTGIGLYISRLVVQEQMNGEISANNSTAGAKFTIKLPKHP